MARLMGINFSMNQMQFFPSIFNPILHAHLLTTDCSLFWFITLYLYEIVFAGPMIFTCFISN
jgi:hypothetical protein